MTYIVINELFVEQADEDLFETNFKASMKGTLDGVPGLQGASLAAPRTPGRGYLSILEFVDRTAYIKYLDSSAFTAAHQWPDHAPFNENQLAEFSRVLEL